jgi:hypothetical protein
MDGNAETGEAIAEEMKNANLLTLLDLPITMENFS